MIPHVPECRRAIRGCQKKKKTGVNSFVLRILPNEGTAVWGVAERILAPGNSNVRHSLPDLQPNALPAKGTSVVTGKKEESGQRTGATKPHIVKKFLFLLENLGGGHGKKGKGKEE